MRYLARSAYAIIGLLAIMIDAALSYAKFYRWVDYDVRAMKWSHPRRTDDTRPVLKSPPTLNLDLRLASILSHMVWQRQMYRVREMA